MRALTGFLLTLVGCLPAAIQAQESSRPAYTFGWPVPGSVEVTERTLRKGHHFEMRYVLAVQPSATPGQLEVSFRDAELLSMDGKEEPVIDDFIAPLLVAAEARPSFIISEYGELLQVVGIEKALKSGIAALRRMAVDEEAVDAMEGFLESPGMMAVIEQKAGDEWSLWAGAWVDLGLEPGEFFETELPAPGMDGTPLMMPFRMDHHGDAEGHPGMVELSFGSEASGDEWEAYMARVLGLITSGVEGADTEAMSAVLEDMDFKKVNTGKVITDPRTLQPVWALMREETRVAVKGEERTEVNEHEYRFRWTGRE